MVEETKQDIETLGFHQLISDVTRSWRGQKDSNLDQVWTNVPEVALSTYNKSRGSSDHYVVGVIIRTKGSEGNHQEYLSRKISGFKLEVYREKLSNIHWEELYQINNLDSANSWLEQKLRSVLQELCPLRVVQPSKKFKSWIRKETLLVFEERDLARQRAKSIYTDKNWSIFRQLRNRATSMMRADKRKHFCELYQNMEDQNNVKGLYSITRTQLGWKRPGPPQSLMIEGRKVTAPKDIADAQLNFYKEKVEKLSASIPRPTEDPLNVLEVAIDQWQNMDGNQPSFCLKEVTVGETLSAIKMMGNRSAFSHDYINAISVKAASETLAAPITYLANLSICQESFAKSWKKAKILPLHKGKGTSTTNPN